MNYALLKEIVSHVMAHYGVIPSDFVDHKITDSLMSPGYLLPEKIHFESEGEEYKGKVWGCQMSMAQTEVKVLLGECTLDKEFPEFAMVIQPKETPIYGIYLCYNEMSNSPKDSQPDLAVTLKGNDWMDCSTYLQGCFLAATEQLRDFRAPWIKCVDYQDLHKFLLSFINFHHAKFGD
jgi:hypothetical protein